MIVKKFLCYEKGGSANNELQGIVYPDGTVVVGIDAWRDLTKYDCSSHPTKKFRTFAEVMDKYQIKRRK